jgi:predicted amidohydrolase YtcJ
VVNMRTVISNAEVDGRLVSVVIEDEIIAAVDERPPSGKAGAIDANGGALIPGLHDHHVHLLAMAARDEGLDLDALDDERAFDLALRHAVDSASDGWVRASGYDEHRHGALDFRRLDALVGATKVRVQHRSGLAWVLSSEGLDAVLGDDMPSGVELDANGRPTGRLLRLDAWLAERVGVTAPSLQKIGAQLSSFGVTGVTDATHKLGAGRAELLRQAVQSGSLPQSLTLLGVSDDERSSVEGWATIGPIKILVDEVVGLDVDLLAKQIEGHHCVGRAVAIHAVSRAETVTVATAMALAGMMPGDRIEHGSVLPTDLDSLLAAGGVTVIVQPALVRERGDHYLEVVDGEDLPFLHRAATLLNAGVRVAAGSDAPVTSADPWLAISAASTRTTRTGQRLGAAERVEAATALGWYLTDALDPSGPIRRVKVGARADLCLLDAPLSEVLANPNASHVRNTWVRGRLVH